jgi:hypothetical protein
VREVVILSLSDSADCAAATPRVPVLACADALRGHGLSVEIVTATDDSEIDTAVKGDHLLVVAAATDGEIRGVVRRMVRHNAPPPSKRPAEMPVGRTMFDLPPMAILPLSPAVPSLLDVLGAGVPREPAEVAAAVAAGQSRRLDLLRTDNGSVTLHSALVGGVTATGTAGAWRGQVEVDDAILTHGDEPVIACAITLIGSSTVDSLPLVTDADPHDGLVDVAIAVPQVRRRVLRRPSVGIEVRRARGRAASVTPRLEMETGVPFVDDGVTAKLNRKRSWWVERDAWALYVM